MIAASTQPAPAKPTPAKTLEFLTDGFGTIYVDVGRDGRGIEAYFQADDILAEIDTLGRFKDIWNREYRFYPACSFNDSEATIEVMMPKTIGRAKAN